LSERQDFSLSPGIAYLYTGNTIVVPSDAWGGNYFWRGRAVTSGAASGLAAPFTLTLAKPTTYIVLTWNSALRDLDAHLFWGANHVYYGNLGNLNGTLNAALDHNDTTYSGIEVIGINQRDTSTTYTFAVHNFGNVIPLKGTLAAVRLYYKKTPTSPVTFEEYQAPLSGTGQWWTVFQIKPEGTLVKVDKIGSSPPSSLSSAEAKIDKVKGPLPTQLETPREMFMMIK
jgi:hypothetical protein